MSGILRFETPGIGRITSGRWLPHDADSEVVDAERLVPLERLRTDEARARQSRVEIVHRERADR